MKYLAGAFLLLLLSSSYFFWKFEPALLIIPAASVIFSGFFGQGFRNALAALFALHFVSASAFLYLARFTYQPLGALALAYLFAMAAVSYLELGAKGAMKGDRK